MSFGVPSRTVTADSIALDRSGGYRDLVAGSEGRPYPHYSPDGRWFWTGEVWIPASQVLHELPAQEYRYVPPALPMPVRTVERLARWPIVVAAALMVALALGGIGNYALDHRQASAPPTPAPTPSAEAILRSPFTHHVGSATFEASGILPGKQTATGEIFFTPHRAYEITEAINGTFAQQFLDVDGYAYARDQRGGPWQLDPTYNGEYFYLDWDGSPATRNIEVGGPVKVNGEQAWHLWDGLGDQWWIGVDSGRPLEAIDLGYRYIFSNFGKARPLHAPAASQVQTQVYRGGIGQPLQTPEFSINVSSPQVSQGSGTNAAPNGFSYLSLQVAVTNTSGVPIGVPLGNPVVTSPEGGEYWQDASQESQALPDGTQLVAPGATETGTLVFDVENGVKQVRLLLSTSQMTPDPLETNDYLAVVMVSL